MKKISSLIIATIGLISCNTSNDKADGYGNFEATETLFHAMRDLQKEVEKGGAA